MVDPLEPGPCETCGHGPDGHDLEGYAECMWRGCECKHYAWDPLAREDGVPDLVFDAPEDATPPQSSRPATFAEIEVEKQQKVAERLPIPATRDEIYGIMVRAIQAASKDKAFKKLDFNTRLQVEAARRLLENHES
jgi:hypothetical protein